MREVEAGALGIERISDLTFRAPKLEIFGDYDFFGRPEWKGSRRPRLVGEVFHERSSRS